MLRTEREPQRHIDAAEQALRRAAGSDVPQASFGDVCHRSGVKRDTITLASAPEQASVPSLYDPTTGFWILENDAKDGPEEDVLSSRRRARGHSHR
jgi:hypothetical protein